MLATRRTSGQPLCMTAFTERSASSAHLIEVASGRLPADLVVRQGRWVNVHSGEVLPGYDVAIAAGRIAAVATDLGHAIGPDTRIIDAEDRYLVPGLCDAHMHVEAGGAADDHEGTQMEDAIARVRQGMRAMLRLGSAWFDVAPQIRAVTEAGLDPRYLILCTDDSHAGTLVRDGHMNRVVRHAIAQGLKPIEAIRMATLNTAEHFGMERELGSITPGRRADLILTSSLVDLPIETVIARGEVLAEQGTLLREMERFDYPSNARDTVRVGRTLQASEFYVPAPDGLQEGAQVTARVIGVVESQAPTRSLEASLPIVAGHVGIDADQDVCHVAVIERHHASGAVVNGFVNGFGYTGPCALASTVGHDAHQLIVAGTSPQDMALAANHLAGTGGGFCFAADGKIKAVVELPIAGLMSDEPAQSVALKADALQEADSA